MRIFSPFGPRPSDNQSVTKPVFGIRVCVVLAFVCSTLSYAQSGSGTIKGTVLDQSGAAISGATVAIVNPVSHYQQSAKTDAQGSFEFDNVPYNNYHLTATATGMQSAEQDVNVRSAIPVEAKVSLKIGVETTSVTVESSADLVETDPTTHTDVDRNLFDKLPLSSTSSVSSLVTLASPGVSGDSNGLMHGLGDHASNSFSVDGQPISDQQSKVFSNQIPIDSVQSMEVIEGAPPAEYGDKTSLVIVVTTRSGLGVTQPHGEVTTSFGSFGSTNGGFNVAYGGNNWGNFISASGLGTSRFLDGPEFVVMHDHGNEENFFDRFDVKPSSKDTINLNFAYTRSWFQTPNSYDAQDATAWTGLFGPGTDSSVGSTDQRSKIRTFNIAPVWTRVQNANTVFTFGGFARQDQFNYYPSADPFADFIPDLQTNSISQSRRLTNLGLRGSVSIVKGIHNIKLGFTAQDTIITEQDGFAIVDPDFNAVCLNANGSAYTNPNVNNPALCGIGVPFFGLRRNPSFVPLLACLDLTRPGTLPASDGCSSSTPSPYTFNGHADIRELALYLQDTITLKSWTFNLGLRGDVYRGITKASQAEPRIGIAYSIKPSGTVLQVSYARTLETPFNENLVLASLGCNDPVINALQSVAQGYPCLTSPLSPGWRNEFHAGLQQAFGHYLVISGEYIWKYTHQAYDFSVLGNTPITYPIEWASSKIPGYAIRASIPNYHGFTAFVVMSSVAARFFTPQVSGIGTTPISTGSSGVFRIDHDEHFNETTHLQYQFKKRGPWVAFTWRFDSGMVAGPVPCAGGNCANGPNGTDSIVDVSNLTPDQQFQAGLFCGSVHATPTSGISPNGLCPASQYGSALLQIPAAGTENDDHNPPRIASRNLFDAAIGHDNLFHGDRYKWSARLAVENIANKEALYNFLSTFSGTHYVTPRAVTGTIAFHF
jgi:hypothetical protein